MNYEINKPPKVIENNVDLRWKNDTIYNHYESPEAFRDDLISQMDHPSMSDSAKALIEEGDALYAKIDQKDTKYDTKYEDVARKVKDKLIAKGFTTKMLYRGVEFTTLNTGVMSKQRAMLGKRDCFYKNPQADSEGNLFHDLTINLSYSWSIPDSTIVKNSYALYALTKELARVIPMRVFVVNHVGCFPNNVCYSYNLKKFGKPINPKSFLHFTSDSKRTYGWSLYPLMNNGQDVGANVGNPSNTVSIADFSLDRVIDEIFLKVKTHKPGLFK